MTTEAAGAPATDLQPGLDQIGEPLHRTTFVVVDLETTGAARDSGITEIGAVKTRGGEVVGEFQTLVNPGAPIPPMIVALTGITEAMVLEAPPIEQVLPAFLEFLGTDAVLVAHNAPFDVGFLKAACREHGYAWPGNEVVDTVTIARRVVTKDEAPNRKLATLARVFGTRVTPNHRALEDARATSEVLHGMLERLGAWGITHREDLRALRNPVPAKIRAKARMAETVPAKPGAYVFRGPRGEALYVGTSRNLRSRVKSYFTNGEQRRQVRDMLEIAVAVDAHVVPTELEANVLELRLIRELKPRYNRRSTRPERTAWVRLTDEAYPRLVVSRAVDDPAAALGPMRSATDATLAVEALQRAARVRTCTTKLPITPRAHARACLLKDLGECAAPCVAGAGSGYAEDVAGLSEALATDASPLVDTLAAHVASLAAEMEYERASAMRDGIAAMVDGAMRAQRLTAIARCSLVAARPDGDAWQVAAFDRGALVGTERVSRGVWAAAGRLWERGTTLMDTAPPTAEERELVSAWLDSPGVRLLHVEGEWAEPIAGAGRHRHWVQARREDRAATSRGVAWG